MTDDCECRQRYKKTLEIVREHLTSICKEGESIEAEIYGSYGRDCYICIGYHTISGKKHISEGVHMPVGFLSKEALAPVIPIMLDELIGTWRNEIMQKENEGLILK